MGAGPMDEDDDASIAARAANGEGHEPEAEAELFPQGTVEGDAKTIKTLIRGGLPIETTVSMRSAEVPSGGGLLDPDREGRLLVTFEVDKYEPVPIREGDPGNKRVAKWKIRTVVRPVFVERVDGATSEIEANFAVLMSDDPAQAGALLDRLRERAESALATA